MKARLPWLLLCLCGAAFLYGLIQLFLWRFEEGDVYPEYSSLRADPLGTMAFYESLERLPGLTVKRDFSPEAPFPPGASTTYLHLGTTSDEWPNVSDEQFREMQHFLARGGRLVITFFPENNASARAFSRPPTGTKNSKSGKTSPPGKTKRQRRTPILSESDNHEVSLQAQWGVEVSRAGLPRGTNDMFEPVAVTNRSTLPLPSALAWHSALLFTNLAPEWQTVYARGTNPVLVARSFGPGTVVLASDSFFLSNQALSQDRHADLLAWLVGSNRQVFFDEAHLGLLENPGVATLVRKYRLHGLMASLLILAGLFIWKNALSFVPPPSAPIQAGAVQGRDAAAGFINLLRRNLPASQLLQICFEEWTKSLGHSGSYSIARVDQAQAVLEAENARARTARDPVRAYREISQALKGKKYL